MQLSSFKKLKLKNISMGILAIFAIFSLVSMITLYSIYINSGKSAHNWSAFQENATNKQKELSQISHLLGYGNMIHNFKNYVMRSSDKYYIMASNNIRELEGSINRYKNLNTTPEEIQYLNDLNDTISLYSKALSRAKSLWDKGTSAPDIDEKIKIDDTSAIRALTKLREILTFQNDIESKKITTSLDNISYLAEKSVWVMGGLAIFLVVSLAYILLRLIISPLKSIIETVNNINNGDYHIASGITGFKEANEVETSFKRLIRNNTYLVNIAEKIGSGDFNAGIELSESGKGDILGRSLKKMALDLKKLDSENKKQLWIKSEVSNLMKSVQGIRNLQSLLATITTKLANVLHVGHAAFYLAESTPGDAEQYLLLQASYAYIERKNLSNRFKVGEGIIGQCALEKNTIIMTEVPEDYIKITSGLGEKRPNIIMAVPIVFEGTVLGVYEFACFQFFSEEQKAVLIEVANSLGIIINNVEVHSRTEDLLKNSQELSEKLQTQQEELKTVNEELEEKARVLEESENELKSQSEELQATNEELEEKSYYLEEQKIEIERKNKALEQAKSAIELKASELEASGRYKSEFLANMSHELRTPLNSLLILSQSLAENDKGNLTEEQVKEVEIIHNGGQELLTLINDILDLSKVEAGKMTLLIEESSLIRVVEQLSDAFLPVAEKQGLAFHTEIQPEAPQEVMMDSQKVVQILRNLLSNAFKFTKEGSVSLHVYLPPTSQVYQSPSLKPGEVIGWSVQDTGIGISEEQQKVVFEAFQQADGSTSREFGGTGLGLTISRQLAHLMGGELCLKSEPNVGTTFTLYVPLYQEAQTPTVAPPVNAFASVKTKLELPTSSEIEAVISDDREKIAADSHVILIIEDDLSFAQVLLEHARKKGYLGVVTNKGMDGLALAMKYPLTAILLDLGLPDVDGMHVLNHLKDCVEMRHIPIHIISAADCSPEVMRRGAIGFLTKPIKKKDLDTVFEKISALLEKGIKEVLLVEDDPKSQKAIKKLVANERISIVTAQNGLEAKKHILERAIDCMILDLNLPDLSGSALLEQLSKEGIELPPTIVYTGKELTDEEYSELRKFTSSIVVKGADSPERLLDEVSLFLHSVESDLPKQQQAIIRGLHKSERNLEDRRILLVDDDMRNLFALSKVLSKHGLSIKLAKNGQDALDKLTAEKEAIELVIMDIMMPIMDGYEAITKIRTQPEFKNLPIIALTAKAMPEDRQKCIDVGANDYLSKPVDVTNLLSLIRVWLGKT